MIPAVEHKLKRIEFLQTELQSPDATKNIDKFRLLGKELRELEKLKDAYERYLKVVAEIEGAEHILADASSDKELRAMAEVEVQDARKSKDALQAEIDELLVPRDPILDKNAVIEVRAGTGGAEASLFAGELMRMYTRYASQYNFKTEILSQATTEAGGIREMIISVSGPGAYGKYKFESGTHRVQRVPATEASGRIHTSAVTVAVFPEVEDVEVEIKNEDLRIDVFRSGGPGGQSVNTTDSAVRILHVPTGLIVKCQDEKSQLKNKAKAMKILRARLFDIAQREKEQKMAQERKQQVGSGDRSEKIRTYNFPDRRVTDHRIGLSLHKLEAIIDGDMDDLVNALYAEERKVETTNG